MKFSGLRMMKYPNLRITKYPDLRKKILPRAVLCMIMLCCFPAAAGCGAPESSVTETVPADSSTGSSGSAAYSVSHAADSAGSSSLTVISEQSGGSASSVSDSDDAGSASGVSESDASSDSGTDADASPDLYAPYVRTADDAGEDDASAPLDVTAVTGTAGTDFPACPDDPDTWSGNPDFQGIIYIPCIGLHYPVFWKQYDNEFYLSHDTDGATEKESGSVEIDGWNLPDFTDCNTIIYGHNMADGSMFGKLINMLSDPSDVDQDPYIYFYRGNDVLQYRIFAMNRTDASDPAYQIAELHWQIAGRERSLPTDLLDSDFVNSASDTDGDGVPDAASIEVYPAESAQLQYNTWYDIYVADAMHVSEYTPAEEPDFSKRPRLIMLATCSGPVDGNGRFLVHAVISAQFT